MWASGGWLFKLGALDFAGGTVVHISSGVSALVLALVLGRRIGYPHSGRCSPHNLTMTLLGAGILWFGWFGFNAGSALAANGSPAQRLRGHHIAAAAGGARPGASSSGMHRGKATRARRRLGRGGGPGRHHAGLRLRRR